jgi:hypothetical protein
LRPFGIVTPERRSEAQLDVKNCPRRTWHRDRLPPAPERARSIAKPAPSRQFGQEAGDQVFFAPDELITRQLRAVKKQAKTVEKQFRKSYKQAEEREVPRYRAMLMKNHDLINQAPIRAAKSPIMLISQLKVAIRNTYDMATELSRQMSDSLTGENPLEPLPEEYRPATPSVRVAYVRPASAIQKLYPDRPSLRRSNPRPTATQGLGKASYCPGK